jgi:GTP1/Obg family GTP-binding protein
MPAKSVQVITDDLNYVNFIDQYIHETDMHKVGTNYKSIAIIGCQSSGKSTLLNILFETDFEELNQSNKGMAQTTKGIWVAHNKDKNILIYDIEGTDSRERGDERLTFEQTTSLFALAMADVLMINMWTQDVGRYTASNYGLLKVIFEVNLKLFAQSQSQKKLIFILRDFNKHEHNKEKMTELLENNMRTIWNEIYKEEKFLHSSPHDFFDFEFFMMPHKIYQPEDFKETGDILKKKFNVDDEDSVFPKVESTNVPIDGLPMYIENCWE